MVDPPADGESVAVLAERLGRPHAAIAAAAGALTRAGLASPGPGGIRASSAALAFEALWPTGL